MQRTPGFSILVGMRVRSLPRVAAAFGAVLVLVLPSVAGGARKPRAGDGTLSVQGAKGIIQIAARGTFIGRVKQGQVLVIDRNPNDGSVEIVRGGRVRQLTETREWHQGRNIRFRLSGGLYRLKIQGRGINLAAVGHGSVTLDGDERYADTGIYSLNGGDFLPVPYDPESLQLAAPEVTGG
jgi:hypothetical protein